VAEGDPFELTEGGGKRALAAEPLLLAVEGQVDAMTPARQLAQSGLEVPEVAGMAHEEQHVHPGSPLWVQRADVASPV
jgi:hypothetical protein